MVVARVAQQYTDGGRPFSERVWTAAELEYCDGKAERLAARWAAKEAVLKTLGVGLPGLALTDIEVGNDEGRPVISLSGRALEQANSLGIREWSLSLSHDGGMAVAMVAAVLA